MKSFKIGLCRHYIDWSTTHYSSLPSSSNVPVLSRSDVTDWLQNVWDKISTNTVRKKFEHIGLVPTDLSPPDTPYPDTLFSFMDQSDVAEDDAHDEVYYD